MLSRVVLDKSNRFVGDGVRVVVVVRLDLDGCLVAYEGGGVEKAARPTERAVEAIEAPLKGPVVLRGPLLVAGPMPNLLGYVPFAGHVGGVACGLERLRDGDAAVVQITPVSFEALVAHHVAHAGLVGIKSGKETRPRGAAAGRVVELGEAQAARG